jgi:hypothetical protein
MVRHGGGLLLIIDCLFLRGRGRGTLKEYREVVFGLEAIASRIGSEYQATSGKRFALKLLTIGDRGIAPRPVRSDFGVFGFPAFRIWISDSPASAGVCLRLREKKLRNLMMLKHFGR